MHSSLRRLALIAGALTMVPLLAGLTPASANDSEHSGTSYMNTRERTESDRANHRQGDDNEGAHDGSENGGGRGFAGAKAASTAANIYSRGGPVSSGSPVVVLVYWGWNASSWSQKADARNYVTAFFNGQVNGNAWLDSTTQYCDGVTSGFVGPCTSRFVGRVASVVVVDDNTSVPSRLRSSDIANAAKRAAKQYGASKDIIYTVLTPKGRSQSGFGTQWCAYHSWTYAANSAQLAYAYVPYMPDAGWSCGANSVNANGAFDGFSIVGGHELAEALTDPFPSSGWLDSAGAENADKCAWISLANTVLSTGSFAVQPLWSNAMPGCVLSYP